MKMSDIEKNVSEALSTDLERELPTMVRTAGDDIDKFMATASRMLIAVRDQIAEAESRYAMARAKLTDEYRRKMERLANEGQEHLRKLDADATADLDKRRRMLKALLAMRGD
jgi:hypothetical protein